MSKDPAPNRVAILAVVRLCGVFCLMAGIAAINQLWDLPEVLGAVLVGIGLLVFFVLPLVLARRWRTPPE